MRTRRMGDTGLAISEIGFGSGGNAGLMVRGSFAEQRETVSRALALGISYFDTAPDYGSGTAEENLGRVLRALKAHPIITSKVEVRQENRGDIAGHILHSAEESLRRLGVDALDVLQIHNGPTAAPLRLEGRGYAQLSLEDFLRPGGAIDGLERVLRQGKARFAGFVCRGNDGDEVRRLLATGIFRMINLPYTLLNPTAGGPKPAGLEVDRDFGGVIEAAQEAGAGTAVHSALAGGILADAEVQGAHRHPLARAADPTAEKTRRGRAQAAQLRFLARETGLTLAQAAYRFVLSHPGVTTVIGGFSDGKQLEELAAVSGAGPLAPDLLSRLDRIWRSNFKSCTPSEKSGAIQSTDQKSRSRHGP